MIYRRQSIPLPRDIQLIVFKAKERRIDIRRLKPKIRIRSAPRSPDRRPAGTVKGKQRRQTRIVQIFCR